MITELQALLPITNTVQIQKETKPKAKYETHDVVYA